MTASEERLRVLQQLETGELSVEEAINELGVEEAALIQESPSQALGRWRNWWLLPFTIGVVFTGFGVWLAQQGGWWWLAAAPSLLFGVPVILLSLGSVRSPWVHVRIRNRSGSWPRTFGISLPIPTRLAAWILRTFGPMIPQLEATAIDELLMALGSEGAPLHVEVDAGPSGERIEVFIG
jgi:hypothetical protein